MATLRGEITISAAPAPCATSFVPAGKLVTANPRVRLGTFRYAQLSSGQSLYSRSGLHLLNLLRSKRKFRAELRSYLASSPRRESKQEEHAREPDGRRGPTI